MSTAPGDDTPPLQLITLQDIAGYTRGGEVTGPADHFSLPAGYIAVTMGIGGSLWEYKLLPPLPPPAGIRDDDAEAPRPERPGYGCPDGGSCHHPCEDACFRVGACGPLSGVYPGDSWPGYVRLDPRPVEVVPLREADRVVFSGSEGTGRIWVIDRLDGPDYRGRMGGTCSVRRGSTVKHGVSLGRLQLAYPGDQEKETTS